MTSGASLGTTAAGHHQALRNSTSLGFLCPFSQFCVPPKLSANTSKFVKYSSCACFIRSPYRRCTLNWREPDACQMLVTAIICLRPKRRGGKPAIASAAILSEYAKSRLLCLRRRRYSQSDCIFESNFCVGMGLTAGCSPRFHFHICKNE